MHSHVLLPLFTVPDYFPPGESVQWHDALSHALLRLVQSNHTVKILRGHRKGKGWGHAARCKLAGCCVRRRIKVWLLCGGKGRGGEGREG